MKKCIYICLQIIMYFFFILHPYKIAAQWLLQTTPVNGTFYDMCFVNKNIGYVVGDSMKILKTTNGGINWTLQHNLEPSHSFTGIQFINANTGFVTMSEGVVLKTTNGGSNWDSLLSANLNMNSICFSDFNTGYIAGMNAAIILKTTNAGSNWFQITVPNAYNNQIVFLNNMTGFLCGYEYLLKTTNGGLNWNTSMSGGFMWRSVCFVNGNIGFAALDSLPPYHGRVYKTVNGGSTWTVIFRTQTEFKDIFFEDSLNGYVISPYSEGILKTTNGGLNWQPQSYGGGYLFCMEFTGIDTGYIAGTHVHKTTNGGTPAGIINISSETPSDFSLQQNYPNPFNPVTKIKFAIPPDSRIRGNDNVTLKIYDVLGREVVTLVNEQLQPGTYEVEWDGKDYPSGVYLYKLITDEFKETRKMVLLK